MWQSKRSIKKGAICVLLCFYFILVYFLLFVFFSLFFFYLLIWSHNLDIWVLCLYVCWSGDTNSWNCTECTLYMWQCEILIKTVLWEKKGGGFLGSGWYFWPFVAEHTVSRCGGQRHSTVISFLKKGLSFDLPVNINIKSCTQEPKYFRITYKTWRRRTNY